MTIRVNDGDTPLVVLFSGSIEISRAGDALVICRASDDAKVWGVAVDATKVERRMAMFSGVSEFWNGLPPYVPLSIPRSWPWDKS